MWSIALAGPHKPMRNGICADIEMLMPGSFGEPYVLELILAERISELKLRHEVVRA